MTPKEIVIYKRRAEQTTEDVACIAEPIQVTKDRVVFQTQEYLPVALGLSYYVKQQNQAGLQELWLINFAASTAVKSPYIYTASIVEKWKDVV